MIYSAKYLQVKLASHVEKIVKDNFGPEYSLGKAGEIQVKRESDPFSSYAGKWHVIDDEVCIVITK